MADLLYFLKENGIAQIAALNSRTTRQEGPNRRITCQGAKEALAVPSHKGEHIGTFSVVIVPGGATFHAVNGGIKCACGNGFFFSAHLSFVVLIQVFTPGIKCLGTALIAMKLDHLVPVAIVASCLRFCWQCCAWPFHGQSDGGGAVLKHPLLARC